MRTVSCTHNAASTADCALRRTGWAASTDCSLGTDGVHVSSKEPAHPTANRATDSFTTPHAPATAAINKSGAEEAT